MYENDDALLADSADKLFGAMMTTEVWVAVDLGDCSHFVGVSVEDNNRCRPLQIWSLFRPDIINPDLLIGNQDLRLSDSLVGPQNEWRLQKHRDQETDVADNNQETYTRTGPGRMKHQTTIVEAGKETTGGDPQGQPVQKAPMRALEGSRVPQGRFGAQMACGLPILRRNEASIQVVTRASSAWWWHFQRRWRQ